MAAQRQTYTAKICTANFREFKISRVSESGRSDPTATVMPCTNLSPNSENIGTQTDLAPVKLGFPFVRFLGESECIVPDCHIPNCFHFGLNSTSVKSPRIPVMIGGIKIPMVIDTGAEVSLLSAEAMNKIYPHGLPACQQKQVKSLAGDMVTVKGPFKLSTEICNVLLVHDFFYFSGMDQCLLG